MSTRLFDLLPAVYRVRDRAQGDPLRALLTVIGREVDRVEADIEALYDNWFIETCEAWVVPYIGDLLGVRGLSTVGGLGGHLGALPASDGGHLGALPTPDDTFSPRAYVANTLAYRRRKGTAAVLEQLARDLTGWPARAVEFFARLATTQHLNHVRLDAPATLDIRSAYRMQLVGTPFETATHTAEVRHIDVGRGRYNIPHVGLFLWRAQSYLVIDATARRIDGTRFTFDPLGRSRALFNVPETETALTQLAEPFNVPMPLSRLGFHHHLARYYGGATDVNSVRVKVGAGVRPASEIVACDLSDAGAGQWAHAAPAGRIALDPERGRLAFADAPADEVVVSFAYGLGGDLGGGPYDRRASLAEAMKAGTTWQVGVMRDPPAAQTQIKATLAEAVAEWNEQPPGSRGVIVLMDSRTYEEDLDTAQTRVTLPASSQLVIVAGQWPEEETNDPLRPLARLTGRVAPTGVRPHLRGTIEVAGTAPAGSPALGRLVLNGLLIEGELRVLAGNLGELHVAHGTLAPSAATFSCQANPDLAVVFTRTISGPLTPGDAAPSLTLADTIVDGDVDARGLVLQSSTILGRTTAETLDASNVICVGHVEVARRQVGCVRFSYLPIDSEAPRRFHCQPTDAASAAGVTPHFVSTTFGDPGYAMLATTCPAQIAAGADDEGEMGAWHFLHAPQRIANLQRALDEYLRFGLEAGILLAHQEPR